MKMSGDVSQPPFKEEWHIVIQTVWDVKLRYVPMEQLAQEVSTGQDGVKVVLEVFYRRLEGSHHTLIVLDLYGRRGCTGHCAAE